MDEGVWGGGWESEGVIIIITGFPAFAKTATGVASFPGYGDVCGSFLATHPAPGNEATTGDAVQVGSMPRPLLSLLGY